MSYCYRPNCDHQDGACEREQVDYTIPPKVEALEAKPGSLEPDRYHGFDEEVEALPEL